MTGFELLARGAAFTLSGFFLLIVSLGIYDCIARKKSFEDFLKRRKMEGALNGNSSNQEK